MPDLTPKPYRIGLALSGGGARGFAHVGALKALEELNLKPDILAGVSAGSVVAVLYSAGVPVDRIMKIFTNTKFRDLCEFTVKGGGFFKIDRFRNIISKEIGSKYQNLEDLPIPVRIGVTDLDHGDRVRFSKGNISEIMGASCSIPILFQPITINGVRYVDGGVMSNMPGWTIRDDCDLLIGVNCSPLPSQGKFKNSVLEIGLRTYNLMLKGNVPEDMKLCDIAIEIPEIASYKVFNLKEIQQVYIRGYVTTKQRVKEWLSQNQNNTKQSDDKA